MNILRHITLLFCIFCIGLLYPQNTENQISTAESLIVQNPEQARKVALELYDSDPNDDKLKLRILFLLANTSNLTGRPVDAIQYGNDALEIAKEENDNLTQIKLYGILGNLYQSIPLNEKTKNYLNRAEKLIETSKLPDSLDYIKGNIYYLKGMNYANTLDCKMAINYFNKAIQVYTSSKNPLSIINLKLAYLNKGFCDIELGNTDEARKMLQLSRVETEKKETLQPPLSPAFMKQQNLYADFGDAKLGAAEGDFSHSSAILEKLLSENDKENLSVIIADLYEQLVENNLKNGDLQQSKKYELLHQQEIKKRKEFQEKLLDTLIKHEQKINTEKNKKLYQKYLFSSLIILSIGSLILFFLLSKIRKSSAKRKNLMQNIFNN